MKNHNCKLWPFCSFSLQDVYSWYNTLSAKIPGPVTAYIQPHYQQILYSYIHTLTLETERHIIIPEEKFQNRTLHGGFISLTINVYMVTCIRPDSRSVYFFLSFFLTFLEAQWHVYAITYVDFSSHTQKIIMMKNTMNIIKVGMHIKHCHIFVIL
jgi:hypothetical protein